MAKQNPVKPASQAKPEQPRTTSHYYRIERLTQYETQAYVITKLPDGTFKEVLFGKATLPELVIRKISQAMQSEAHEVFRDNKALAQK